MGLFKELTDIFRWVYIISNTKSIFYVLYIYLHLLLLNFRMKCSKYFALNVAGYMLSQELWPVQSTPKFFKENLFFPNLDLRHV